MKKSLLILGLAVTLFSCDKNQSSSAGLKTAYIDTVKLMEEYEGLKDWESKGKVKKEEMERELQEDVEQFKQDYAAAEYQVKTKGPEWAQRKAEELQRRERDLGIKQESMMRQLQEEFGVKRDTILSQMKKHIKEYGKKQGYDYIYGTGDAASILYGKEEYDITEEIIKELNKNYKGEKGKTEEVEEVEEDSTATK